ncbi:MAG TPA: hypothetical protein VHI78_01410 [Bacteroidales bacterium]|jgi:hypothetical protein|nr:hypothetical protein [Bacteroidales bacterium]
MPKYFVILFLILAVAAGSCKSGGPSENKGGEIPDSVLNEGVEISEEVMQDIVQNISSPVEMAAMIKDLGVPYSNKYISTTDRVGNLTTSFQQSLNLGIYAADLGYLNMYNKTSAVVDYLTAIKTLSDAIKVGQFFDFSTLKRLATNSKNLDSLMYISVHSFNQMDKYLHTNNRTNLSALMVTGVWIEGLYLGTQVYKATPNQELAERIGEQKLTLDQLMLILDKYQRDKQYTNLLEELQKLKELFGSVVIYTKKGEPKMIEVDGMLTIVGGDESIVEISPDLLNNIINTTEQVRNKLISL